MGFSIVRDANKWDLAGLYLSSLTSASGTATAGYSFFKKKSETRMFKLLRARPLMVCNVSASE